METPPPITPAGRPKALIASAIIAMVVGVFGLLSSIPALLLLSGMKMPAADPMTKAMIEDPTIHYVQTYGRLLGVVAGAILLAGGISLLRCREWARKAVVGWSMYSILAASVDAYVAIFRIVPLMEKVMHENFSYSESASATAARAAKIGSIVATGRAVSGLLFSVGVGLALMIVLTRPRVKAACQGRLAT